MVILPGCTCCGGGCDTREATSGGPGTTVDTYTFPAEEHCILFSWDAIVVPDEFVVSVGGSPIFNTGYVAGTGSKCITKPSGETDVSVTVTGPDPTGWSYVLECENCSGVIPPPRICCQELETCVSEGISIRKCQFVEDARGRCDDSEPPACENGECTETGVSPAIAAPYDCLNNAYQNGAWVTVTGWLAYVGDKSEVDNEEQLLIWAKAELVMNRSFFVPFSCLGNKSVQIEIGEGTASDPPCPSPWSATISVNLCERVITAVVGNGSCYLSSATVRYEAGPLSYTDIPCNNFDGCACGEFGGENVQEYEGQNVVNGTIFIANA